MAEKRAIFEDVSGEKSTAPLAPKGGMIDKGQGGARLAIRAWIILLGVLVFAMIVVGGLTRLTDSGLSITEWRPLTGALPPLNEAHWLSEFEKYKQIPEFQLQNKWMDLHDFKVIYWWEWGHRQLGRVVGLVWAVGFLWFALRRQIPTGWTPRLLLLGGLGGLQGAIGWWMVSSGLTGSMTDVASYRLATHLGLAFVIIGFITWYALLLSRPERDLMQARRLREAKLFSLGTGWMHFAFLQILLGALVAGIDAGRSYTDWPLMGGQFVPPNPLMIEPIWRNFFENPGLVQFIHRMAGYVLLGFTIMIFFKARKSANRTTKSAFFLAVYVLFFQIALGIYTVVTAAPWHIAIAHQATAALLWVLIIRARFMAQYPRASSIREG